MEIPAAALTMEMEARGLGMDLAKVLTGEPPLPVQLERMQTWQRTLDLSEPARFDLAQQIASVQQEIHAFEQRGVEF